MKTKYLYLLSKCLLAAVVAFTAFACSDNDDNIDTSALTLVSNAPEDGAYIYSNDTIVLTFSKEVRQAEGSSITINNVDTRIVINNEKVYFHVSAPTASSVTLNIPSGALTDRNGNQTFAGITLKYNIEVRKQAVMVVDANGNGDYTTVQDAIRDVPSSNDAPYLIFVANGTYEELVDINKPYVHLIGQDWDNTIITYKTCRLSESDYNKELAKAEANRSFNPTAAWNNSSRNTSNGNNIPEGRDGATIITALNFYAENISFENKWGVDEQTGPQAEAIHTRADRSAFYHCKFRGFQDTWWTRNYTSGSSENINMRNYADNCWIEGGTDYIFGGGNLLIENSTFYNVGQQNYITAGSHMASTQWGYVFRNCIISGNGRAANGIIYFGRAWQQRPMTVFINTSCSLPICDEGWYTMSALPKLYAEYNTTNQGWPVDTSKRRTTYDVSKSYSESGVDEKNVPYTGPIVLTEAEANECNYENIIQANDNWNPRSYYEKLPDPTFTLNDATLTWTDNINAVCYLIFKNGNYFGKTTETSYLVDDNSARYTVKAVNRFGSLSNSETH